MSGSRTRSTSSSTAGRPSTYRPTVAAHAGVLGGHVVAEAMVAKYLVLRSRDVSRPGSRANRRDAGFESLVVEREGAFLRPARFSEHESPADLRVIAVHARGQL